MLSEEQVMAAAASVKPEQTAKDELEILFQGPVEFTVSGELVKIRPFTFGELPKVIALLRGVGGTFAYWNASGKLNTVEGMMDIVATGGENLIQTLALNVGKPREWFDSIPADEGIALLLEFLKLNLSFFTKRVVPLLQMEK